jgi:dTMP kinase
VLIAFEGGEGAGKSSQLQLLAETLRQRGLPVLTTFEPGATAAGRRIRALLLEGVDSLTSRAEALLFAADRAEHVATVIAPALERGDVVLCDRYVDSSLAYQGAGRTLLAADIAALSWFATGGLVPDLTVLLDIDPQLGLARARRRAAADRLERETVTFHQAVRSGFLALARADTNRYLVLDAAAPAQELADTISAVVIALLAGVAADQ